MKQIVKRQLAVVGMVLAALSAAGNTSLGQGTVRAEFGDWQMSCDTPPGASTEQCAIIQNVMA